ncbi:MAG: hypothetical protein KDK89_05130 [Alphaproteobacteria bacterium]|nr:hypothetical protein [Alphaproteobacteria bacterium]
MKSSPGKGRHGDEAGFFAPLGCHEIDRAVDNAPAGRLSAGLRGRFGWPDRFDPPASVT